MLEDRKKRGVFILMISDIKDLIIHFAVDKFMDKATPVQKSDFLQFRANFIEEELSELYQSINENNKEEIVDALIDIIVVALGTLEAYKIDTTKAWKEVHRANMSKEIGINPTRENNGDIPDAIKPKGWKAPNHNGNTGLL